MSTFNILVILAYFLTIVGISIWSSRLANSGDDFLMAGRSLRWPVVGASLFMSNVSSSTLVGLMGAAYKNGIAVSAYEWMAILVLCIAALRVYPKFVALKVTTVPEFLEHHYNRHARIYFALLTVVLTVLVDTAVSLYAGALTLHVFLPDYDLATMVYCLAAFAGLYTVMGGLRAVVYTDVLQGFFLVIGVIILTMLIFKDYGFSFFKLREALPVGHLSMIRSASDPMMPWPGIFLGVSSMGFWYWCTNQYVVQRAMASKTQKDATRGAIFAAILKYIPIFCMILPGVMALPLMPGLENGDKIFSMLIKNYLPDGFSGLMIAALMAGIMSSVDSALHSSSTIIIHDIMPIFYAKKLGESALLKLCRIVMIVVVIFAALWSPYIAQFDGVFHYIQQIYGFLVPPVAVVFLFRMFSNYGNRSSAFWSILISNLFGLIFSYLIYIKGAFLKDLHYQYVTSLVFLFGCFSYVVSTMVIKQAAPIPKLQLGDINVSKEDRYWVWALLASVVILLVYFF